MGGYYIGNNVYQNMVSRTYKEKIDRSIVANRLRQYERSAKRHRAVQRASGAHTTYTAYSRLPGGASANGRFQPSPFGSERKYLDTQSSLLAPGTTAVVASDYFQLIPRSTDASGRIGQACTLERIQINGSIRHLPGAAANPSDVLYMWLVLDKECNGATATLSDMFVGTAPEFLHMNIGNSNRFSILKKWIVPLNVQGGERNSTSSLNIALPWEAYIKCKIPLRWNSGDTTGAATNLLMNRFYIVHGVMNNAGLTSVDCNIRVRYKDANN